MVSQVSQGSIVSWKESRRNQKKFYLTVIKPLLAKWLMKFYNHIMSEKGSEIIINGWKRSGIYDAAKNGSSSLPSIDPFNEIDPLVVTEKSN